MRKPRVLFLCTGNSARSQMAEGFLRHFAGDRFEVESAGIDPKGVNQLAIAAMREVGVDLSEHRSKTAGSLLGQHFRYVITVCDNANERCPIFPGMVTRLHWQLEDPAKATGSESERLSVFRRIRDEIGDRVRDFVAEHEYGAGSRGVREQGDGDVPTCEPLTHDAGPYAGIEKKRCAHRLGDDPLGERRPLQAHARFATLGRGARVVSAARIASSLSRITRSERALRFNAGHRPAIWTAEKGSD
ncbi:MAG: arsenate reductase ArsC [Pirellulales bacterium]